MHTHTCAHTYTHSHTQKRSIHFLRIMVIPNFNTYIIILYNYAVSSILESQNYLEIIINEQADVATLSYENNSTYRPRLAFLRLLL